MRLFVSLAVFGLMVSSALPAMAQQNSGTGTSADYSVPMYNDAGAAYYNNTTGTAPVYNSTARPLPLNQMVAGKNAPSYNYNKTQPYNNFGGDPLAGADLSALSPEQARLIRAQRDANAQRAQAEYMATLQQQQQGGAANPYLQGAGQMYNQFAQPTPKAPAKRRVVYKEKNNPLVTPPRLFNPDQ